MTPPTVRDIPPAVRDVLREVHRLVVRRRHWAEVASALDAAGSLPDAEADLVALERLEAVTRYPVAAVSDEDVERVLAATAAERAAMPEGDAAWWLRRACWRRPALAARHGVQGDESGGEDAGTEPGERVPEEVIEASRYAFALRRMGWPAEDALAVLDEAETLPAAAGHLAVLTHDRIMLGHLYELSEDVMDEMIQRAVRAHAGAPAWLLAGTIATAAGRHPALAVAYLPDVITTAEGELRTSPHEHGQKSLASARGALERARASAGE